MARRKVCARYFPDTAKPFWSFILFDSDRCVIQVVELAPDSVHESVLYTRFIRHEVCRHWTPHKVVTELLTLCLMFTWPSIPDLSEPNFVWLIFIAELINVATLSTPFCIPSRNEGMSIKLYSVEFAFIKREWNFIMEHRSSCSRATLRRGKLQVLVVQLF